MKIDPHYVSVLKWKRGERDGLKLLRREVRPRITPLIEMLPPKAEQNYAADFVEQLVAAWGTGRVMLDSAKLGGIENGVALYGAALALAAKQDVSVVPVVGLHRDKKQIRTALAPRARGLAGRGHPAGLGGLGGSGGGGHNRGGGRGAGPPPNNHHLARPPPPPPRGLALRVNTEDMGGVDDSGRDVLKTEVARFVTAAGTPRDRIDLLLDVGPLAGISTREAAAAVARHMVAAAPDLEAWRSVTLLASAFPQSVDAKSGGTTTIERVEFPIWRALAAEHPRLRFGDYAIQHPTLKELDPKKIKPAAAIRYTDEDHWLVVKGNSVKDHGGAQFRSLAKRVVTAPEYKQPAHCTGCEAAMACSEGELTAGSLEAWRRYGTTHHLTLTTEQLGALAAAA